MLSLTAYFDESGTHAGSQAVALAGFLATPGGWDRFGTDWKAALEEFGLPFFHMSTFAHRREHYAGWTEDQRRACLGRLLAIINEHVVGSVGNVVPVGMYDRLFSPDGPARLKTGGPYGLAMAANMLSVADVVRLLPGDPSVTYIYESGAEGRHQATKVFNDNLKDPEAKKHFRLVSLEFQDKPDAVGLQAADILAYELHRELPRHLSVGPKPAQRYPLTALANMPHSWGWLNEEELKKFAFIMTMATHFGTGTWHKD